MNIWLINHYAVPTVYYPLARPATFAKYLIQAGHKVTIFAASTVHNSDKNMIMDKSIYKEDIVDGIHYVYIRTSNYKGNGLKRIINMFQFPLRLPKVVKFFEKPDAILSTSVTPMACTTGLKLARKYNCKAVAEVADLWPETFVSYGLIGHRNPILKLMYAYEKRMYKLADKIIFTMEGGKDYIIEKRWDKANGGPIDLNTVYHINNGVDLEEYKYNAEANMFGDEDLDDEDIFKVVYTGSIRRANCLGFVLDAAKYIHNKRVRFLLWGNGDQVDSLLRRIEDEHINNVKIKGSVKKSTIPSILSRSDVNFFILEDSALFRFGLSLNKSFEYLASGKPIVIVGDAAYSMVDKYNCGVHIRSHDPMQFASAIDEIALKSKSDIQIISENTSKAALMYDFHTLTENLMKIIKTD